MTMEDDKKRMRNRKQNSGGYNGKVKQRQDALSTIEKFDILAFIGFGSLLTMRVTLWLGQQFSWAGTGCTVKNFSHTLAGLNLIVMWIAIRPVNFLANNYYGLSILDEKFGLAGILFIVVIVLYKLVCQMIARHCFSPHSLAPSASTSECVLPDDVLMEILVRLPVSSILHFRNVSRSFRSLVLECHTRNRFPPLLVGVFCVNKYKKRVEYVSLLKGFGDSSMDYCPTWFLREPDLYNGMKDCKFGIVLSTAPWVSEEIYIWNPATKKCRTVACNDQRNCRFVLAFDPSWSKQHYEVVKFSYGCLAKDYDFEVFSSKTGRWDRKFSVTKCDFDLMLKPCFANGILYMFERYSDLIAINCADGSYKRVALPCFNLDGGSRELCNSSGTLMYSKLCRGELSVWALVKNENESYWLLRHRISLKAEVRRLGFSYPSELYEDSILLFHWDTIVLCIDRRTFIYNIESHQLRPDMPRAYGGPVLPWSPSYYAVAGL